MGKKTKQPPDGLDELRDVVDGGDPEAPVKKTDRRGILKLAGAALVGAAGAAAVRAIPAAAADGSYMVLGSGNINQESTTTFLQSNHASQPVFEAQGTVALRGFGVAQGGAAGSAEVGVLGTTKSGAGTGVSGQASGGIGVQGVDGSGTAVWGAGGSGRGVLGVAAIDQAANYLKGGYDVQLGYLPPTGRNNGPIGSGRLAQIGRPDVAFAAPNWNPAFSVSTPNTVFFQHELVRGYFGEIWASRSDTTSATRARWKRINAVRVDSADGAGTPFKPFRVLDTRLPGPLTGKKAPGSVTVVPVAGKGTGTSTIPADAIAVMGNLTAVGYSGGGWAAIMPGGIGIGSGAGQFNPASDPSSINFITGQGAIANAFVCGLSGGAVQVYIAVSATYFIIDITAYLQ